MAYICAARQKYALDRDVGAPATAGGEPTEGMRRRPACDDACRSRSRRGTRHSFRAVVAPRGRATRALGRARFGAPGPVGVLGRAPGRNGPTLTRPGVVSRRQEVASEGVGVGGKGVGVGDFAFQDHRPELVGGHDPNLIDAFLGAAGREVGR